MPSALQKNLPPDDVERRRALDPSRSVLVRAPAGSGKTDLLTRRFLRLLGEVDDPGQIVAITFTKAAAAEMRHRILSKLEEAAASGDSGAGDPFSMEHLAQRALERSLARGWNLLDLPAQLRIATIDSFCRELALQQPLLSGLGGSLEIFDEPLELYRRAARRTLEAIDGTDAALREAIEWLLLWRDNSWQDVEKQLVEMLAKRDQWMHGFVLGEHPDWDALRNELEQSFARALRNHLGELSRLLDQVPGACEELLALARFGCEQSAGALYQELAELADFPAAPFDSAEELDGARQGCACVAELLLIGDGHFRKQVNVNQGFPKERKAEKARLINLIASLSAVPGLEATLAGARDLPPARYTDEDWEIIKACFILLRRAAAELQVVFAEAAVADFVEVAQIALAVLKGEDGAPTDATLAAADGVRHLLVDEFQDTSRRQHQLLAQLVAAWAEREDRTCFVVGDPVQSIYSFRNADAELFPRVEQLGLEIPGDLPLRFDSVKLTANFRTSPPLVDQINEAFRQIFALDDGGGIEFEEAEPARDGLGAAAVQDSADPDPRLQLHLEFMPRSKVGRSSDSNAANEGDRIQREREEAGEAQTREIVELISRHWEEIERAREQNQQKSEQEKKNYRVAVLARARRSLAPVAAALREAAIPFRAIELEHLKERPEILDALALTRALFNPQDRVAWLGVLRAPWCGLSLTELHTLVSADSAELLARPVPELVAERMKLLGDEGRLAVKRVLRSAEFWERLRSTQPTAAMGTWLEQVWLRLGGAQCVDAAARANLDLFWSCLDSLPQGEPDLLGPALDAALDKLAALPDPNADGDCGVQLMTIHKAKGLEFEVVIVPDLQGRSAGGQGEMLSWLERGLAPDPDTDEAGDAGEITEFLVAPFQSKGADPGATKKWVDRMCRDREKQESRRVLYVAATRAREELHLFARLAYKTEKDGSLCLTEPFESLLKTAWPAFETEIRRRFEEWRVGQAKPDEGGIEFASVEVDSIAASGEDNLLVMPAPPRPTLMRRLPVNFSVAEGEFAGAAIDAPLSVSRLYERHEGGLVSRALGKAVHLLLQKLAEFLESQTIEAAGAALTKLKPRIAANIRAAGVDAAQANRIAEQALQTALQAAADPIGQWVLAPHSEAANEIRWTGVVEGILRTVQVDRVFRAGSAPKSAVAGNESWWIIDYKTVHEDGLNPAVALPALRDMFALQIEAYAKILRNLHGASESVRGGLYYPRMSLLDWWEM